MVHQGNTTEADMTTSISRDLNAARSAFESGDISASLRAHSRSPVEASAPVEAGHAAGDRNIAKAFVFAGYDGLSSVATLACCAVFLDLPSSSAALLVLGGTLSLGLSSTVREYTRYRAACDHFTKERSREKWELDNFQEGESFFFLLRIRLIKLTDRHIFILHSVFFHTGEVNEMCELYVAKGMSSEHARLAISTLSTYPDLFVDLMMVQELGLSVPDTQPWRVCIATAAGYALWGVATAFALVAVMPHQWNVMHFSRLSNVFLRFYSFVQGVDNSQAHFESWSAVVREILHDADPAPALFLLFFVAIASHSVVRRFMLPSRTRWWMPGVLLLTSASAIMVVTVVAMALRKF
jgi:hypothetical protein